MSSEVTHPRRLAKVPDVIDYLGVSRATVYRMMADGRLSTVKLGRSRRIKWDAVDRMVDQGEV